VYYKPLSTNEDCNETPSKKKGHPQYWKHFHKRRCYAINPDKSTQLEVWDAIMMTALVEVALECPYEIAFHKPKFDWVFWTSRGIDICFLIDMIMRFFVAYPDLISARMVSDFYLIAKRYLTGWFFVDMVSLVPWDWIVLVQESWDTSGSSPAYHNPWRILRLLRILRIVRATHGQRIMSRLQVHIGISYTLLTFWWNVCLMLVGCHWSACLWGWVAMSEKYKEVGDFEGKFTWLSAVSASKGGPEQYSEAIEIYWVALYWAVMTMTGVGYGDIVPQNHFEYKVAVVTMVLVSLVWAFVVGNIVTVLATLNPHETHFKQNMDDLNMLLSDWSVPQHLRVQLRRYFVQAKQMNHYLEQKLLLERVSPHLHAEVSIHLHQEWVKNVKFFNRLPLVELISVVRLLTTVMYAPEEDIPAHRSLFIVWRGMCVRRGRVYLRNDVWGDDMILENRVLRSSVSSRAVSFVELLILDYYELEEHVGRSPALSQEINAAKKFIAFTKGMLLLKRVMHELSHAKIIIDRHALSQAQRLELVDIILTGRITEDVARMPRQIEKVRAICDRNEKVSKQASMTLAAQNTSEIACGPSSSDVLQADRVYGQESSSASVLENFEWDDANPKCTPELKAMAADLLEELLARAHADGAKSREKVTSNMNSNVKPAASESEPSSTARHSHARASQAKHHHLLPLSSGLSKLGAIGHSVSARIGNGAHGRRSSSYGSRLTRGGSH
jgi:potassium voltage-gated channel Eag-related subfamily H protein 7